MAPGRITTLDLTRARARRSGASQGASQSHASAGKARSANRLQEVTGFGANPGSLRMLAYAPPNLTKGAPLVVVLHGCTQTAANYDLHSGWTALAEDRGFAVLYPEQVRANNPMNCFNWFQIGDASRGLGETQSIREMIETLAARHDLDRDRIFVTGLSAGAAMAAALLADYPEVFSAGALIAGLPCGAAANAHEAFEAMARPRAADAVTLGDAVRAGSRHAGPWPRVSIWHGTKDKTVAPGNADALVAQWLDVHGGEPAAYREDRVDGQRRRTWTVEGRDVVELVNVTGMGHGAPLDARLGERPGPFMLEAGVSSTRRIAEFFGVAPAPQIAVDERPDRPAEEPRRAAAPRPEPARNAAHGRVDVLATITGALRSAGLMR